MMLLSLIVMVNAAGTENINITFVLSFIAFVVCAIKFLSMVKK